MERDKDDDDDDDDVHLKLTRRQFSLAHSAKKLTFPIKRKTAGLRGVSPVGGKVELWRKGFVEKIS